MPTIHFFYGLVSIILFVAVFLWAFSKKRSIRKTKNTIKRKVTLIIAASVITVAIFSAILTYFIGSATLVKILGKEYSQIARTLSVYTVNAIEGEIEDAMSYTTRPLWKDMVMESNSRYEGMSAELIKLKFLEMDKRWTTAEPRDPIFKEYLENRLSLGMQETVKTRTNISEIFITDKYGGLVSSSNKTSDFYQADEKWWQVAYNDGKGGIYVSDIEFDDSSKKWVISIAVPIRGPKDEEVIGVCKDSVGIEKLFGNLANFKLGKTGHAVLIDSNGVTVFHHGISAMTEKMFSEKMLRKILEMKNSYLTLKNPLFHKRALFLAFDEVKPPHISESGVSWIVLIAQDISEVFAPINSFIIQIAIIAILAMILVIPMGSFLSKFISDHIHELHLATERVMAGDWDYKIDVKTGDEIEQFADTFKVMIADIKSKQETLQNFSNSLEVKVKERTEELSVAQEATLNILEDLQESKKALERTNRELMKLDELKSEFISTVSHELRTPLSIIKEGISLVLDKIPGDLNEKQAKILSISKYNIDRLARIIDGLLDLSKIEAGKIHLKRRLISMPDIVRQIAGLFELKIKEKGLEMRLDIDNVIGNVWADPDRIIQVLTNLVGNAVKFTNSGHIEISCKDKGDAVVCSVSDTGLGISKDDIPKVFEKFQQFGRTAGAGEKGTGLGLSIAKNIMDMHNGAIWVESNPEKGSKFAFKLHKYTSQSLFAEYVSKAVKIAADKNAEVSIMAVKSSLTGKDISGAISRKFNDIMQDVAALIKNALRREGDDIISDGGEMIVILTDCDRESAAKVQYRFEEVILKYLAERNADDAIKVNYGYATYPDDAKDSMGLIEKAKAALAASAEA